MQPLQVGMQWNKLKHITKSAQKIAEAASEIDIIITMPKSRKACAGAYYRKIAQ